MKHASLRWPCVSEKSPKDPGSWLLVAEITINYKSVHAVSRSGAYPDSFLTHLYTFLRRSVSVSAWGILWGQLITVVSATTVQLGKHWSGNILTGVRPGCFRSQSYMGSEWLHLYDKMSLHLLQAILSINESEIAVKLAFHLKALSFSMFFGDICWN